MSKEDNRPTEVYELSDIGFLDAIEIRTVIALLEGQNGKSINRALAK